MKIAVISDIHLKVEDRTPKSNQFGIQTKIRDLLETCDKVILNGDIFDCYVGKSWNDTEKNAYKLLKKYNTLVTYIASNDNIIYISGNHDTSIATMAPQFGLKAHKNYEITNSSGNIFRFSHGHEIDPLSINKIIRFLSFLSVNILNSIIFRKKGHEYELHRWVKRMKNISRYKNKTYLKYCKKLFNNNPDIVFQCFGHTHIPSWNVIESKFGKRHYLNCGTNIEYRDDYLIVDTEELKYKLNSIYPTKLTRKRAKRIKKGDILAAFNTNNILSHIISSIPEGPDYNISHIALCKSNKRCIEAVSTGVKERRVSNFIKNKYRLVILRPYDKDKKKIDDMVNHANNRVGSKYAYKQIIYLAIDTLLGYIGIHIKDKDVDIDEYTCSEIVAESYLASYETPIYANIIPSMIHPYHILISDKLFAMMEEN